MEQTFKKRPSRTRKAPAGLSDYDTAREDAADPQSGTPVPANTPSPAREWAGKQVRSPKRRRFEETAKLTHSPPASSIPSASGLGKPEPEVEEDSEVPEAQEEQDTMSKDESGADKPSALMQLPQELLAKILGALPSNYLIQASGVCFPSPPPEMIMFCTKNSILTCCVSCTVQGKA